MPSGLPHRQQHVGQAVQQAGMWPRTFAPVVNNGCLHCWPDVHPNSLRGQVLSTVLSRATSPAGDCLSWHILQDTADPWPKARMDDNTAWTRHVTSLQEEGLWGQTLRLTGLLLNPDHAPGPTPGWGAELTGSSLAWMTTQPICGCRRFFLP